MHKFIPVGHNTNSVAELLVAVTGHCDLVVLEPRVLEVMKINYKFCVILLQTVTLKAQSQELFSYDQCSLIKKKNVQKYFCY